MVSQWDTCSIAYVKGCHAEPSEIVHGLCIVRSCHTKTPHLHQATGPAAGLAVVANVERAAMEEAGVSQLGAQAEGGPAQEMEVLR